MKYLQKLSVITRNTIAAITISLAGFSTIMATGGVAISSLAMTTSLANAECLLNGEMQDHIAKKDCREAQRTGCVRSMLSAGEYKRCLKANKTARRSGSACVIGGRMYSEFSAEDCVEAKETGCVRRLLSENEYEACLDRQKDL